MDTLREAIAGKKERLDRLRPLPPEALAKLEHYYDIELTYTSNAIEGNTLSAVETTLVIEQGVTIGGKPLKDHLEALDHYDAIRYVREMARQAAPIIEADVRNLHSLVVRRSRPDIAGRYAGSCPLRAHGDRAARISNSSRDPGSYGRLRRMAGHGTGQPGDGL